MGQDGPSSARIVCYPNVLVLVHVHVHVHGGKGEIV